MEGNVEGDYESSKEVCFHVSHRLTLEYHNETQNSGISCNSGPKFLKFNDLVEHCYLIPNVCY